MTKVATSFRLDPENKSKLKALAKREKTTISQIINKIIDNYAGNEGKILSISESGTTKKLETLEKELALQRQRINIFKNQVDFIVKSQNGKIKSDRYSKINRSKQSLARYTK